MNKLFSNKNIDETPNKNWFFRKHDLKNRKKDYFFVFFSNYFFSGTQTMVSNAEVLSGRAILKMKHVC